MRIKQAHIYGFGRWVDESIDFSKDGLVCVFGENESGKSTLQKFILFMLFGLPPKARQFYRPKTSGRMGGRLVIADQEIGEFTIERIDEVKNGAAICYGSNGKTQDEVWLKEKLNGINNRIYQSVFSFSALDLIHFKKMKDEDLGEILLSIGLTGSNRVYETEKKLDFQIGELFKPFGKVPTINKQLDLLDSLKKEMDSQLEKERSYRHKKEQLEEITSDITSMTKSVKQQKEALVLIEKKKQALPLLEDYYDHQEQLNNFPSEVKFPQDGLTRLKLLKDKLLPIKSEWSVIKSSQEQARSSLSQIESEMFHEAILMEAKEMMQLKDSYLQSHHTLLSLKENQLKLSAKISTKLDELNLEINDRELQNMSFPFQTEKHWGELRARSEKLEIEKAQVKQEINSLQKQRHYLFNQLFEFESKLLDEQHRIKLEQRVQTYINNEHLKTVMMESSQKKKEWQKTRKEKEKHSNVLLVGSLFLTAIAVLTAYVFNIFSLYYVGLLILATGFGQWTWRRQSFKQAERLLVLDDSNLSITDNISENERLEGERLLEQHNQSKQTMTSIQSQLKTVEGQIISLEDKESALLQLAHKLREEIESERQTYPFLKQIQVMYWPDMYYAMNQLLGMNREKIVLDQRYKDIKREQQNENERLFHFVKEIMDIQREGDDLVLNSGKNNVDVYFEYIEHILNDQSELKRSYAQTKKLSEDYNKRQDELQEKLQVYEQEIAVLFSTAEVDTEESFYKKSYDVELKNSLEHKLQDIAKQLSMMFPQMALDALVQEKLDESALAFDYEATTANIEEYENIIDQKRQEMADLNAKIASIETSETYSKMIHQFNIEIEQLQKLAKKWAVLKTAKEVLTETKRRFRDKYLTKVIKQTSDYFSQITNGKYKEVLPPTDEDIFQVVANDGIRYSVDELSQGTVDQLYISLRLAISHVVSQDLQLPFIIDDALVHFDDIRTDRMIDILHRIAKNQQVILFTCKPHIRQQVTDAQIIYLGESTLIS